MHTDLMRRVFDALPSLVFVVDHDVRILEYNAAAKPFLEKKTAVIKQRAGNVLHCIHAVQSERGCATTPFCETCVIRNSVSGAAQGNRIVRVRKRLQLIQNEETQDIYALISASPFEYTHQRLVLLVIELVGDIQQIQQMLPICCVCHRIRNEKQTWLKLEQYFKRYWDVSLTHDYCPVCFKKQIDSLNSQNQN